MSARSNTNALPYVPGLVRLYRDLIRWLHARSFAFSPDYLDPREGLVAAVIVTGLVWVAYLCHQAMFGWAAFAAFWTMLVDPGQTDKLRIKAMMGFVLAGAALAGCMSFVASKGPAATAVILFAVVYLCAATRHIRPCLAQVGVLLNVVVVVAVGTSQDAQSALTLAGVFLLGGGIATAAHIVLSCVSTVRSPHRATSAVFRTLGDMTDDLLLVVSGQPHAINHRRALLEVAHRAAVREAIEVARARTRHGDADLCDLSAIVESCDKIFGSMIALSHHYQAPQREAACALEIELIAQLRSALKEGSKQIIRNRPDRRWAQTSADALKLRACQIDSPLAGAAMVWSDELHAISLCAPNVARHPSTPPTMPVAKRKANQESARGRRSPHALRMAGIVVLMFGMGQALHLNYAYWATMAVVVVMQPGEGIAWPRMVERIIGSIAGALGAAALALALTQPWQLFTLIFLAAAATVALRSVNYTLYVVFLTPLFVWVNDLLGPGLGAASSIALARATDNVLGSALCLLAWLLLGASRSARSLPSVVADAVEANLRYAALACAQRTAPDLVDAARCRAGLASNEAEASLHRLKLEGRYYRHQLDSAEAVLIALRRLAGASAFADLHGVRHSDMEAEVRSARYLKLSDRSRDVIGGKGQAGGDIFFTMDTSHPVDTSVLQVVCAHSDFQLVVAAA